MIARSTLAALRQVLSPPLRRLVLRALGLTIVILVLVWVGLTNGFGWLLRTYPLSVDYPVLDGFVYFMAGAGLLVALVYLVPVTTALVGGFYADDAAAIVERTDFPADPPGTPLPTGRSVLYGLRFAAFALVVNLAALTLFFIPVVNVAAFFAANAYLLSREYFEMAAARYMPIAAAAELRRENRATVLAAGAVLAGLVLVPVLNLAVPVFATALMIHVHKRIAAGSSRAVRAEAAPGA